MIDRGMIETDGSEELVTLIDEGDGAWRVGALIHKDDAESIHEDFRGHQEGTPAPLETQAVYLLRRKVETE
jgi:hypothetical protein